MKKISANIILFECRGKQYTLAQLMTFLESDADSHHFLMRIAEAEWFAQYAEDENMQPEPEKLQMEIDRFRYQNSLLSSEKLSTWMLECDCDSDDFLDGLLKQYWYKRLKKENYHQNYQEEIQSILKDVDLSFELLFSAEFRQIMNQFSIHILKENLENVLTNASLCFTKNDIENYILHHQNDFFYIKYYEIDLAGKMHVTKEILARFMDQESLESILKDMDLAVEEKAGFSYDLEKAGVKIDRLSNFHPFLYETEDSIRIILLKEKLHSESTMQKVLERAAEIMLQNHMEHLIKENIFFNI